MHLRTKTLLQNLRLTALAIFLGAVSGWIVSFLVNLFWNNEATRFVMGDLGAIDTSLLKDYENTRRLIILFFMGASTVAAQVSFALTYRKEEEHAVAKTPVEAESTSV